MDKFEEVMKCLEVAQLFLPHSEFHRLRLAVEDLRPPIIDLSEAAIRAHRIDDGWVIMEEVDLALKAAGLTSVEPGYSTYVAESEYQDVIRGARRAAMVASGGTVLDERGFLDELATKAELNFPKCPYCGSMHCHHSGVDLPFPSCLKENACKVGALPTFPPEGV